MFGRKSRTRQEFEMMEKMRIKAMAEEHEKARRMVEEIFKRQIKRGVIV